MDNLKKGLIILLISIIIFGGYMFNEDNKFNDCAEDLARDICDEKGYNFYKLNNQKTNMYYDAFLCLHGSREIVDTTFLFLEEEIERCKNEPRY